MIIIIRALEKRDYYIYKSCYENHEFKHCIFGDKDIDVRNTFDALVDESNNNNEHYIVLYKTSETESSNNVIGFCNFLMYDRYPFEITQETYAFHGGILPALFNKGYGIYACASMIQLFFKKHPNSILYASTFNFNVRSVRMLTSLGFKLLPQKWYGKNHLTLEHIQFTQNPFALRVLSRINILSVI